MRVLACALGALVSFGVLLAAAQTPPASGRITGIVHLVAPKGGRLRSGAYPSRQVNRPAAPASELANVIISVKGAPPPAQLPAMRATVAQQDETFVPRVVAITRGSTVDFPNVDPYFHNVFSLSRTATFDLGRYRRGDSRSRTFTRAGLVKVFCHIHSEMAAGIMVFDHPYFTTPQQDGTFTIDDVPAGSYELSAWHERIGESLKKIEVTPNGTARVEFALPVDVR